MRIIQDVIPTPRFRMRGTGGMWTEGKKQAFLTAYREWPNVSRAARAAGVGRTTHYAWLNHDPKYAEAFREAKEEAVDMLLGEAYRRAVDGVNRLVRYRGEPVQIRSETTGELEYLYETVYSDRLAMVLLEIFRPEQYKREPRRGRAAR